MASISFRGATTCLFKVSLGLVALSCRAPGSTPPDWRWNPRRGVPLRPSDFSDRPAIRLSPFGRSNHLLYLVAMPPASLRRLALADATEETIRRLIDHGDDLLVERKQDLPESPKFGATVASFANTLGGWLLLGVGDDGSIVGYPKDTPLDVQSHLGHLLRNEVDPVPPLGMAVRQIDGVAVSIVRVFESDDTPVLVRRDRSDLRARCWREAAVEGPQEPA